MEEARCWTWAKTKPDLSPQILSSSEAVMNPFPDSWEEQAFAFDSSGSLGGCVWPPRSYSCSFCRREFRSAQALGGHMNVHRRERARLKQSPIISSTTDHQVAANYTSQICSFLCKNPNPEISNTLASHQRNIGIRASSPPCLLSPVVVQDSTSTVVVSSTQPCWSSFVNEKKDLVLGSIANQEKKSTFVVEKNSKKYLSMSLDFVVRQTDTNGSDDSYKRRKIEYKPLSFFQESNKLAGGFQTEVFKPSLGSVEELDLELRLGDAPKVK